MAEVELLAWDIGGVLLSDGWDREERREACRHFGLDESGFERRHESVVDEFERGRLSLDDYLGQVVGAGRPEGELAEWKRFIFEQSVGDEAMLSMVRELADEGRYFLAALNDESREINLHRIHEFHLDEVFDAFFSSCFTGFRKPSSEAFRMLLDVCQRDSSTVAFVDDRPENVDAAARSGMLAIQFHDAGQLRRELERVGVRWG
ncbi:MAG TPA: HAD family hydrolase [Thermoplasmata archaeon]|nr:HAD family hydrolase [Thermoplasmata archaeon]